MIPQGAGRKPLNPTVISLLSDAKFIRAVYLIMESFLGSYLNDQTISEFIQTAPPYTPINKPVLPNEKVSFDAKATSHDVVMTKNITWNNQPTAGAAVGTEIRPEVGPEIRVATTATATASSRKQRGKKLSADDLALMGTEIFIQIFVFVFIFIFVFFFFCFFDCFDYYFLFILYF